MLTKLLLESLIAPSGGLRKSITVRKDIIFDYKIEYSTDIDINKIFEQNMKDVSDNIVAPICIMF